MSSSSAASAAPATFSGRARELLGTTTFRLGLLQTTIFALAGAVLFALVYTITAGSLAAQLDDEIRADLATLRELADTKGIAALADAIDRIVADPEAVPTFYLL